MLRLTSSDLWFPPATSRLDNLCEGAAALIYLHNFVRGTFPQADRNALFRKVCAWLVDRIAITVDDHQSLDSRARVAA